MSFPITPVSHPCSSKSKLNPDLEVSYSPAFSSSRHSDSSGMRHRNVGGVNRNNQVGDLEFLGESIGREADDEIDSLFLAASPSRPLSVASSSSVSSFFSAVTHMSAPRHRASSGVVAKPLKFKDISGIGPLLDRTGHAMAREKVPKKRFDFIVGSTAIVAAAVICAANILGASLGVTILIGSFILILMKALNDSRWQSDNNRRQPQVSRLG